MVGMHGPWHPKLVLQQSLEGCLSQRSEATALFLPPPAFSVLSGFLMLANATSLSWCYQSDGHILNDPQMHLLCISFVFLCNFNVIAFQCFSLFCFCGRRVEEMWGLYNADRYCRGKSSFTMAVGRHLFLYIVRHSLLLHSESVDVMVIVKCLCVF